jgi:V/A-type H+/Na+-transporting ATPase subunit E
MKIDELTQKIYQDGVEKAKEEQKSILDAARREADDLTAAAKKEAQRIVESAKSEAEEVKRRLNTEIELAADQSVSLLKQRVTDILVDAALAPTVREVMSDKEFIVSLIRTVVEKWETSQTNVDVSVILPEKDKKAFEELFKSKAGAALKNGVEVKFQGRMPAGFVIGPKDNAFKLSFGEAEFVEFFKSFLRPRTAEILFPGKKG